MKYFICSCALLLSFLHGDECEEGIVLIKHLEQLAVCKKCEPNANTPPTTSKEEVSAYECRQQVRKATKELRTLVETLISERVPGFLQKIKTFRRLNPYIDLLERNGLACCQNSQTAECCTEPLVEQLKLWNSEGLPKN